MLKQLEDMKELGIPSIIVSTKDDVLLLIGEAKYKLKVSEDSGGLYGQLQCICIVVSTEVKIYTILCTVQHLQ